MDGPGLGRGPLADAGKVGVPRSCPPGPFSGSDPSP